MFPVYLLGLFYLVLGEKENKKVMSNLQPSCFVLWGHRQNRAVFFMSINIMILF